MDNRANIQKVMDPDSIPECILKELNINRADLKDRYVYQEKYTLLLNSVLRYHMIPKERERLHKQLNEL